MVNDCRHGKFVTVNGLRACENILSSYGDDPERKEIVLAQLASTMVDGSSGIEILEKMFFEEENEEIIDLAIEILDNHFGYDEDFFCDSDGFPANGETNTKFYREMMGIDDEDGEDPIFH